MVWRRRRSRSSFFVSFLASVRRAERAHANDAVVEQLVGLLRRDPWVTRVNVVVPLAKSHLNLDVFSDLKSDACRLAYKVDAGSQCLTSYH